MAEEKQIQQPELQAATSTAHVLDKRGLPEGVVPKQAQAYVVAGLALLILMAVLFSKNHARTAPKDSALPPATASNSTNQQRIQELEQDLSAVQRESQQQQAQLQKQNAVDSASGTLSATPASDAAPVTHPQSPTEPPRDSIADAEKAMAFKARFASNLVAPAIALDPATTGMKSTAPSASSGQQNTWAAGLEGQAPSSQAAVNDKHAAEINIDTAHGRPYVIFEGTTIDTVLTNRLDSDFTGPVKVMVTNPVYSRDGQHVLIPAGTFILGTTQKIGSMAQKRLAVTFHRMIMPDGYSVDLDQFHGLDQIGDTGLKDKVNNHYLQIFGASIALGVIAGAAESTTHGGYTESGSDMYRQGIASSLSQSSADVLDRFINVPPTITIREGHRIKIYFTQDLLLPAYNDHDMPAVM